MFQNKLHPSIPDQPPLGGLLWRYMDLARFLSLIEHQALHFARADQMSDKWEGASGLYNTQMRPAYYGAGSDAVTAAMKRYHPHLIKQTHMSCWHENDGESAAMWDLYQKDGRGVAVQTTWADLTASIRSDREIFGGRIKYADYKSTFVPEGDHLAPFMYKRKSFEHEREVRLLTITGTGGRENSDAKGWVRIDSVVPEAGVIPIAVDLKQLINCVYVAPNTQPWFVELISKLIQRYGLEVDVRQSDLDSAPLI